MARVPQPRRRELAAVIPAPRPTAESYGAGVGRALSGLADDLGRASAAFDVGARERDEMEAKRLELEIAEKTRAARSRYGALSSQAAVAGYEAYQQELAAIRSGAGAGLTDAKLKERLELAARIRTGEALDYGFRHHDAEKKRHKLELSGARIASAHEDLALTRADERTQDRAERTIFVEIAEQARVAGWGAEKHEIELNKSISAARAKSVILRAGVDLGGALSLYAKRKDSLTEADRAVVEKALVEAQETYARARYGEDPDALERAAGGGLAPRLLDTTRAALSGRGAPTAENRAYVSALHKQAVEAAPLYSEEIDARFPNIPLEKFKVGDKLLIDGAFADRLDQALGEIAAEGGEIVFADYNMSNVLDYRIRKGGVTPGVLLNTPHLLGRAADINIKGLSAEKIEAISKKYGLSLVSPKDYQARGATFGHFDFSLTDRGARNLPAIQVADRRGGDPLLSGLPEGRRAKLVKQAAEARSAAEKRRRDALLRDVFDRVEAGDVSGPQSLRPEEREILGDVGLAKVEAYLKGQVATDEASYFELLGMAKDRPGEFAQVDLLARRGEIDKTDLEKLLKMQAAIEAGGGALGRAAGKDGAPKRVDMDRVMKDAEPVLQRFGVFKPTRSTASIAKQRQWLVLFGAMAERAGEIWQKERRAPTEEEARRFAVEIMRPRSETRSFLWWEWENEEPALEMTIDDVPERERAQIEQALEAKGLPWDEDSVVSSYLALMSRPRPRAGDNPSGAAPDREQSDAPASDAAAIEAIGAENAEAIRKALRAAGRADDDAAVLDLYRILMAQRAKAGEAAK